MIQFLGHISYKNKYLSKMAYKIMVTIVEFLLEINAFPCVTTTFSVCMEEKGIIIMKNCSIGLWIKF